MTTTAALAATTDEVIVRKEGRAGRLTLNRPKALNALTLGMVQTIWTTLLAWRDDPAVELVVLDGAGERGLCAGGDVRSLYDARTEGSGVARRFWREEYRLNALIHRYPKPYVAIMDGIVMGGGVGLSAHARGGGRIVTERSRIAFPETTIGLIPDVGGTWLLSRAPGASGTYLALLGSQMGAADALYAGFADRFVQSADLPALTDRLARGNDPVAAVLAGLSNDAGASKLAGEDKARIDACFGLPSIEAIRDGLAGRHDEQFYKSALDGLGQRSPLAMKATLEALKRARSYPRLEDALTVEFRLCTRLYERGEFTEGVRALIVDKDRKPRWSPPSLPEIDAALVDRLFEPLPAADEPFTGNS